MWTFIVGTKSYMCFTYVDIHITVGANSYMFNKSTFILGANSYMFDMWTCILGANTVATCVFCGHSN